jgi:hypothetical protein
LERDEGLPALLLLSGEESVAVVVGGVAGNSSLWVFEKYGCCEG